MPSSWWIPNIDPIVTRGRRAASPFPCGTWGGSHLALVSLLSGGEWRPSLGRGQGWPALGNCASGAALKTRWKASRAVSGAGIPGAHTEPWRPQPLSLTEPLAIPGPSAWRMGSPVTWLQNPPWSLSIGNSGRNAKLVAVFCLGGCRLSTHRWHHLTEKTFAFEKKNWETVKFSLKLKPSIAKRRSPQKRNF